MPFFSTPKKVTITNERVVPLAGIGPATSPLPRECSTTEPHGRILFAVVEIDALLERETGIEPASLAWKAKVLPLNYSRVGIVQRPRWARPTQAPFGHRSATNSSTVTLARFQKKAGSWWRRLDSNQRRRKPTDLQSAPFSHSGTPP